MRLYCKLVVLVLLTCGTQSVISKGYVRDGLFAARCFIANVAGSSMLEEQLIAECEREYAMNRQREIIAVAMYAAVEPSLP
jgi:hypothetical protein